MGLCVKDTTYAAIVAGTTQTYAGATAVTADISSVTTGTAQDGIVLPQVSPGQVLLVKNVSANAGKVYVTGGGSLDGTAGSTGVASGLAASKTSIFACTSLNSSGGSVYITLLASA